MEEQVRKTIEVIRPAIQADNGDIFLKSVDEATGVVVVELTGACVSCPASTVTLKAGVERILKDRVPGVTGLYLTGPFMHPGGTLTLGGRPTAMVMYQDLGIGLEKGFQL